MRSPNRPPGEAEEVPSRHWADQAADELLRRHPEDKKFVCASGISPSGVVHIGNFREVITVDFVTRALRSRGREVRFLYSWDDYDALRKVPENLPDRKGIESDLRRPLAKVADPFKDCSSYAAHFEKRFEAEIAQLGVRPEFIYQNEAYQRGDYRDGMLKALEHESDIRAILDKYRTEPLPKDWTCLSVFCETCGRDTTEVTARDGLRVRYRCETCREDRETDVAKTGNAKLLWRVDWPMRWAKEGVDFEPGGKDHSSTGGSYDTGAEIIRKVWGREPPYYVQYDFVLAKGLGSKLSSSSGNLITVSEALEVYEPDVLRWLFASRKPNLDFSIAFDLDVLKAYDDFDRTERFAFGAEDGEPKKVTYERRIYELSTVDPAFLTRTKRLPAQFPFRHLCNILQIHLGDVDKAKAYYADSIRTELDESRYRSRATRAWRWITHYAPPEFRFQLRDETMPPPKAKHPEAVRSLIALIESGLPKQEAEVHNRLYELMQSQGLQAKAFFQDIYSILIGKTSGPKLASFLLALDPKRTAELLRRSL